MAGVTSSTCGFRKSNRWWLTWDVLNSSKKTMTLSKPGTTPCSVRLSVKWSSTVRQIFKRTGKRSKALQFLPSKTLRPKIGMPLARTRALLWSWSTHAWLTWVAYTAPTGTSKSTLMSTHASEMTDIPLSSEVMLSEQDWDKEWKETQRPNTTSLTYFLKRLRLKLRHTNWHSYFSWLPNNLNCPLTTQTTI